MRAGAPARVKKPRFRCPAAVRRVFNAGTRQARKRAYFSVMQAGTVAAVQILPTWHVVPYSGGSRRAAGTVHGSGVGSGTYSIMDPG